MPLSLRVGQLIYTRVEAAYSPQRKSGFQTVCHSTSLSAGAVQAIEQRVRCFQQQADIVRWQFFRLDSGAFVLTHTCLLTRPDTTIIDATGRSGAFLAHGLVLTPEQFAAIDYNPWVILTTYPFVSNPQAMVSHIAQTAADGYHTQVTVPDTPVIASIDASAATQDLVALARHAPDVIRKGQSLLLVGSAESITSTLRTAFALMPHQQRSACSFDTCIDRCASRPGLYWMVGASTRPYSGNYLQIELREPHHAVALASKAQAKGMLALDSRDECEHTSPQVVAAGSDGQPEAALASHSRDEPECEPPQVVAAGSDGQPEAALASHSRDERERKPPPEAVLASDSRDECEREPPQKVAVGSDGQPEAALVSHSRGEREHTSQPEVMPAQSSLDEVSVHSARVHPHHSSRRAVMSDRSRARGVQRRSRPNPVLVSRRNEASVWAWVLRFLFSLLKRR